MAYLPFPFFSLLSRYLRHDNLCTRTGIVFVCVCCVEMGTRAWSLQVHVGGINSRTNSDVLTAHGVAEAKNRPYGFSVIEFEIEVTYPGSPSSVTGLWLLLPLLQMGKICM